MNVHVLLILLNELGKRDKMPGLQSIFSRFCNKFNKYNNTGTQIFHCENIEDFAILYATSKWMSVRYVTKSVNH